jgi:hypothetical protein
MDMMSPGRTMPHGVKHSPNLPQGWSVKLPVGGAPFNLNVGGEFHVEIQGAAGVRRVAPSGTPSPGHHGDMVSLCRACHHAIHAW